MARVIQSAGMGDGSRGYAGVCRCEMLRYPSGVPLTGVPSSGASMRISSLLNS